MECMNIYSEPGTKVVFAYPNNGYASEQEHAKQFLTVGAIYTVSDTEVGISYTHVWLREIPNHFFNSVQFAPASRGEAESETP